MCEKSKVDNIINTIDPKTLKCSICEAWTKEEELDFTQLAPVCHLCVDLLNDTCSRITAAGRCNACDDCYDLAVVEYKRRQTTYSE